MRIKILLILFWPIFFSELFNVVGKIQEIYPDLAFQCSRGQLEQFKCLMNSWSENALISNV